MKHYDPSVEEPKILEFWEKEKIYKFKPGKGKVYSIDTPPPTVSGNMHAGHAFSYSQQDFIARFRRMKNSGKNLFYPFGTDDNGIPTEKLVEKLNGVKSKETSRHDFIELCLETLKKITPDFVQDWKNLGISADYKLAYSTIDKNSRKISQKSFIDLFKAGRIYKKEFPTIWCPECQTAIAQAELEDKKTEAYFYTIRFKANSKELRIATTRPELLPACVAIFVNPADDRYRHLKGKTAIVPLFGHIVPVIFDSSADMNKGTGVMMICSYGDKYDVDAVTRHKLNPRIIFDKQGRLTEGRYHGLSIKEARKRIIEDLKQEGLVADQKQITHIVNVHDKCGTEIEFLPTEQWFTKILNKKKELLALGAKIKWHPDHMRKRYENWVHGLNWDWIISRDRHFGVPIPAWECKNCGEIILPNEKELPVDPMATKKTCPKCGSDSKPETKVLDTWATSSLSPQICASLVGNKVKIPFSLRPQAHDIIRTWAFYTIVKSLYHEKKLPWNDIMISGFVTLGGEKLSKTKGITIDPKQIMARYGADVLRYWASSAGLGMDLEYQEKEMVAGKKLVTKLLNASNFVFMNLKNYKPEKPKKLEKWDELFLKLVNTYIFTTTHRFGNYEYSRAKFNMEELFWKFFCDIYLEVVKWRVYNGTKKEKESAQYTLYYSLSTILKIFAPIIPFITEYIYQLYFRKFEKNKSIHISDWPEWDKRQELAEENWRELGWANRFFVFTDIVSKTRGKKTENKKPMNSQIILTLDKKTYDNLKEFLEDLKHVTNAKEIKTGNFKVEFI